MTAKPAHIARASVLEPPSTEAIPSPQVGHANAATGRVGGLAVTLTLPPALSANKYWRPVRIGQHITIVPTAEAKAYRKTVALLARVAGVRLIPGRVALTVRMYPARPLDWAKRAAKDPDHWDDGVRSIDLDNALKVLLDALKNVAFDDDSWVRRIDAERMEPDEHGARVVVMIAPLMPELPL